MSLDSITETIAHFIGTFELTIEQARLRDQYDEFTALRRKVDLDELEDPTRIQIKAELELAPKDYDALPFRFPTPPADPQLPPEPDGPSIKTEITIGTPPAPGRILPDSELAGSGPEYIVLRPELTSEVIGSAVTYTFQSIVLSDNDTVGVGDFRDAGLMTAQAEAALDTALSLHAMAAPSFSISDYASAEYVQDLAAQMQASHGTQVEGATVHQFHGDDALGVIVNGQHVAEAPVWSDLLPAYHQPDETSDEMPLSVAFPAEWDQSKDPEFDDGHTVVAGGNLAINEVALTVGWVDAPFIAVGGQAVSLTAISQVALVSDMDVGSPGGGSGTMVVQSSQIDTQSNPAPWLSGTTSAAGTGSQPAQMTVDWIHGDLVVANFFKQVIDATDIDHIQADISASSTMYALGANQMVNVADVVQLGSFYDLIMIGGDMVSVDMLFQTLALVDDDIVSGGLTGGASAASDGNLLMNQASVTGQGQDTQQALDAGLANALAMDKMDMTALEDALLNDPMFAGMEQMRVLKIDGDLMQLNIVQQVTMLADQDDVFLSGPHAASTEVIAGSNAMLNAANINKLGVDSTVMAAGGAYSDLLLHQASLIDTPDDQISPALANEAIAILMDDAMTAAAGTGAVTGPDLTPTEVLNSHDGLQTMLA